MRTQNYITIPQLAKLLRVSRVAIYNRVRKGQIPAIKIGRDYAITDQTVAEILGRKVTDQGKKRIDDAVHRTVSEYAEALKLLAKE
ncbi:helix-turn-helix domain-containing protein [Nitrospiraceae bacterium AH_259_D15_M11_P09]|nr:helix-turn-helix domain-containing protein [Nitrospiraceae bacterium AH_259_D15_M11_P09]